MNNQTMIPPQIFFYSGDELIQIGKHNVVIIKSKEDFVIKMYNPNKVQISAQITFIDKINGKGIISFDVKPEDTKEIRSIKLIDFIISVNHSKIEIQYLSNDLSVKQLLCDDTVTIKVPAVLTQLISIENFTFVHEYETIECKINYCPICGKKKLEENWVYCPECGTKYFK